MPTTVWDTLAEQAHRLITPPRRGETTASVTLMRSLHRTPPHTPSALCAHLDTATTVLPTLARYAAAGDPHALLMAATLMRHPLRRIADMADPDGYHNPDRDTRDQDTLAIFFTVIRTCAEPHILTSRYLYGAVLRRVLAVRRTQQTTAPVRVEPGAPILDQPDYGPSFDRTAQLLAYARDTRVITTLEHDTLTAMYLHTGVLNPAAAAQALDANVGAVARRAQRAIRKLQRHYAGAVPAAVAA